MVNFQKYITEKLRDRKVSIKKRKPSGFKDLSKDPRLKTTRGIGRKHMNLIPDIRKNTGTVFSSIDDIIQRAKKSNRGIWQVSKRQVVDIAKKYKFLIPNDAFPTKHLGSTGILLWRKEPSKYYLVKKRKQQYK